MEKLHRTICHGNGRRREIRRNYNQTCCMVEGTMEREKEGGQPKWIKVVDTMTSDKYEEEEKAPKKRGKGKAVSLSARTEKAGRRKKIKTRDG